ncbi:hypothetical protein GCM10009634_32390 [Saccharothrix xinjiangensis]
MEILRSRTVRPGYLHAKCQSCARDRSRRLVGMNDSEDVVIRDLPADVVAVGNPARVVRTLGT